MLPSGFSSTAATYGAGDEGGEQEMPLQEDSTKNPVCPYGYSKLAIEWMIQDFSHAYGLSYSILRYFNAQPSNLAVSSINYLHIS